jgi:polysaccharide export outer membrane protein
MALRPRRLQLAVAPQTRTCSLSRTHFQRLAPAVRGYALISSNPGESVKSTASSLCLLLTVLALPSCTSAGLVDTGEVTIKSADALPPPAVTDLTDGRRPHYVGPFDEISVDVFGLPELSRQVRVDSSGHVALPLAGSIDVTAKSPEELARLIEDRLRGSYVKDPRVSVAIIDVVSQTITVDGQVRAPGIYPVLGRMTLMRAIASAQGTSEIADTNHVVVFRQVDGQQMAALYDLRAIRLGAYVDPPVYTNDVIVVDESNARRLFPQILQAVGIAMTPLVAVLGNN